MKKLKYLFWLIFIGFFVLLVYQNIDFFSAKNSLHLDLGIYQRTTPMWTNGAIIGGFVGIAVLIMLIFYFSSRFAVYKANKTIKALKGTLDERTSTLGDLKNEMASIRSGSFPAQSAAGKSENAAGSSEAEDRRSSEL
jgi:hypothetical protein